MWYVQSSRFASHRRGVTLLEVMFAVTFSVVILGVLFSLFGTVSRSVRVTTQINQRFQEATRVMDRLTRDIRTVTFDPAGDEPGFDLSEATSAGADTLLELTLNIGVFPAAGAEESEGGKERRVSYVLQRDPAKSLSRPPDLFRVVGEERELLLEGVEVFELRARYEDEWYSEWPALDDELRPPESVRVVLRVVGEGPERDRTFDVDVLVPAGTVLISRSERL